MLASGVLEWSPHAAHLMVCCAGACRDPSSSASDPEPTRKRHRAFRLDCAESCALACAGSHDWPWTCWPRKISLASPGMRRTRRSIEPLCCSLARESGAQAFVVTWHDDAEDVPESDSAEQMITPPRGIWFDAAQQLWRVSWCEEGQRRSLKFRSRREAEKFRKSLVRAGTIEHRPVHLRQSRVPGVKRERRRGEPSFLVQLTNPVTGKRQYFGKFADMKDAEAAALAAARRFNALRKGQPTKEHKKPRKPSS